MRAENTQKLPKYQTIHNINTIQCCHGNVALRGSSNNFDAPTGSIGYSIPGRSPDFVDHKSLVWQTQTRVGLELLQDFQFLRFCILLEQKEASLSPEWSQSIQEMSRQLVIPSPLSFVYGHPLGSKLHPTRMFAGPPSPPVHSPVGPC